MVFENLTLFEVHLENAHLGPAFGEEEAEEAPAEATEEDVESGGRGPGRSLGLVLFLVVVAAMAVRRYRSGGESVEEEIEEITIDQPAEQ